MGPVEDEDEEEEEEEEETVEEEINQGQVAHQTVETVGFRFEICPLYVCLDLHLYSFLSVSVSQSLSLSDILFYLIRFLFRGERDKRIPVSLTGVVPTVGNCGSAAAAALPDNKHCDV